MTYEEARRKEAIEKQINHIFDEFERGTGFFAEALNNYASALEKLFKIKDYLENKENKYER